ncbi:hypothetical protein LWI29_013174 [Acer saccharum]|uniref:Uncharacterized protein n=1 Tax=Acer saccharum TaxID=4024 RepID=A0AA39VDF5_ACESA|nr:hypothetical protein LWI29_013174 [Acer saccharum]
MTPKTQEDVWLVRQLKNSNGGWNRPLNEELFVEDDAKVGCIDKVRFVVLYGSEWSNSGGKFKYQSGMCKVISVSMETSYESLYDIVSRLVETNPSESSIKMKFIFNSPKVLAPLEVLNDDDV